MSTNHSENELTIEQKAAIAFHAELEGKTWLEVVDERFPNFSELSKEEMKESLAMIDRAMAQMDAGGGRDALEALEQLGAKYGFTIDK